LSDSVSAQDGVKANSLAETKKAERLIGQIIDKRYQLVSLNAVGGMGAVYRAKRLSIGDDVALKILHDSFSGDQTASERFQQEARMAARLKHPNAVNVYDFGATNNDAKYLVMELVEGESLREMLNKHGSFPLSSVAEITQQVCAALDEAHRHGIIHRDIKPDNIIVQATLKGLRVKVLDFGIAKLRDNTIASELTQTGSIMGTPHYMSPEQCLGEELDQRSDIYSIGIVVYQMLCGRLPFNATVATAVVVQHVNQPPPSLRALNPGIPPAVESVVYHALEKRRDARPFSAGALADELNQAVLTANQQSHYSGSSQPPTSQPNTGQNYPVSGNFPNAGNTSSRQEIQPSGAAYSGDMPTVQLSSPATAGYSSVPTGNISNSKSFNNQRTPNAGRTTKFIIIGIAAFLILPLLTGVAALFWLGSKDDKSAEVKTTNQEVKTTNQEVKTTAEQGAARQPAPPIGKVFVPGGEFMMGRDDGKLVDEKPMHKVAVEPFFMDIYEITNRQYAEFIKLTNHQPLTEWRNGVYPNGQADFPAVNVNWEDANAFCKNAGKRLPTEKEWEFAARGIGSLLYPWGNDWKPGQANVESQALAEIGKFKGASPFGIYDLIGNAGEWTASDFKAYPNGKLDAFYAGKTNLKTVRGGNIGLERESATATYRLGWQAIGAETYDATGFRCAQDVEK
jgi:serine/threonine-protein kinase